MIGNPPTPPSLEGSATLESLIENCIANDGEVAIARVIHHMYRAKYVTTGVSPSSALTWYEYDPETRHWKEIYKGITLRHKISSEVAAVFGDFRERLCERMSALEMGSSAERVVMNRVRKLDCMILQFQKSSFLNRLMKECGLLFFDAAFAPVPGR